LSISGVIVVSVPVPKQDRAKSFYVDALGCEVQKMPPGGLQGQVLASHDISRDHADLSKRCVSFRQGIEDAPWGRFTVFDDPDGNGWVLVEETPGEPCRA
jgi:predicted enzyme related to lactoylglutathione lyase